MTKQFPTIKILLIGVSALLLLRLVSLGLYPLMDTTEARYGEMARIMLETGNWVTPMFDYSVPFWGKPPMFTWLSALGFEAMGVNEIGARMPHFLVGIAIIGLVFYFAKGLVSISSCSAIFCCSVSVYYIIPYLLWFGDDRYRSHLLAHAFYVKFLASLAPSGKKVGIPIFYWVSPWVTF